MGIETERRDERIKEKRNGRKVIIAEFYAFFKC